MMHVQEIVDVQSKEGDFTKFYKELDVLLGEHGKAAEERRKYQVAHLPLATSVSQLINKV